MNGDNRKGYQAPDLPVSGEAKKSDIANRYNKQRRGMSSRKKIIAAGVVAISLAAAALVFTAVNDKSFELDGNIVANTAGKVDWASLYDVSGSAVPTPKTSLPTSFGP